MAKSPSRSRDLNVTSPLASWMPRRRLLPAWHTPADLYLASKRIDGLPNQEWTFTVFSRRAVVFELPDPIRMCYEYLRSYESVLWTLQAASLLRSRGIPDNAVPRVGLGMEFFASGFYAPDWQLPLPDADDRFVGRHYVSATGWKDDGDALVFQHGWTEWGDQGRGGSITRDYFAAHVDCAEVTQRIDVGYFPAVMELPPRRRKNFEAIAKEWMTQEQPEVEQISHRGRSYVLETHLGVSLETHTTIDVFEIRNAIRPIARAHLHHNDPEPHLATLHECFVWPSLRRKGFGRILVERAIQSAQETKRTHLRLPLYEADAAGIYRAAAVEFAESLGFHWTGETGRCPNIVDVAIKEL